VHLDPPLPFASIPAIHQQQVLAGTGNATDASEIDQQDTAAITARPPLLARLSKCPRNLQSCGESISMVLAAVRLLN
jgi:hypothetical protein